MGVMETGGIYAFVRIRAKSILIIWRAIRSENNEAEFLFAADLSSVFWPADVVARDCGCRISSHTISGGLAQHVYIDSFRPSVHRCDKKSHPGEKPEMSYCESQVFEQFRRRGDKIHFPTEFTFGRYSLILRHYCIWRDEFVRKCAIGESIIDTDGLKSRAAFIIIKQKRRTSSHWVFSMLRFLFA